MKGTLQVFKAWIVIPVVAGSSPVSRPTSHKEFKRFSIRQSLLQVTRELHLCINITSRTHQKEFGLLCILGSN